MIPEPSTNDAPGHDEVVSDTHVVAPDENRWIRFALGGEDYILDVLSVQEVLRPVEITPIPGAPAPVLGVINLRGRVVPVLALRRVLGLPERELTDATRLVVVDLQEEAVALWVDDVTGVISLPETAIEPPPNSGTGASRLWVAGVCQLEETLLMQLSPEALLASCRADRGAAND